MPAKPANATTPTPTVTGAGAVLNGTDRNQVVVVPLTYQEDFPHTLQELKPTFIVVYDPDPALTREIEMYKALHMATHPVRLYFMVYDNGAEQQQYLSSLKREKNAFEKLIHLKAHLALPVALPLSAVDGAAGTTPAGAAGGGAGAGGAFGGGTDSWGITLDSRAKRELKAASTVGRGLGGVAVQRTGQRVVVDMREFRSKLPSMLHLSGIEVVPVTLEVGDYVLSPDICVERKSLSDLIGSFASGRLHNQAKAMTRAYKHAVLLIEFDSDRRFSLCPASQLPGDVQGNHIMSKLVLLTLHFPTLKLLWSQNPHNTVQLFLELKKRTKEPDPEDAAAVRFDDDVFGLHEDAAVRELLMKLPGVTAFNIRTILNSSKVRNLADLVSCTLAEMRQLLGPINGKRLHDFVNARHDV